MIVYVVGVTNGCIFYDDIPLRQPEDTEVASRTVSLCLHAHRHKQPQHTRLHS